MIEGKILKYTVRVHRKSGQVLEFQSNYTPDVKFESDLRQTWITAKVKAEDANSYPESYPVCPWEEGDVILTEENPKP